MVPPLIRLIVREPSLFVDHLGAYGDALAAGLKLSRPLYVRVLVGWAMLVLGAVSGLILSGISLLLYVTLRREELAYVLVPVAPLLIALAGLILIKATKPSAGFERLVGELREDLGQMRLL